MAAAFFDHSRRDAVGEGDLNAVARERTRLNRFGDKRCPGRRGHCCIGIVGTLSSYAYLPFWHTLLTVLGYSVKVPRLDRMDLFKEQAEDTIPSGNVCTPARSTHKRVLELIDRGVDGLLAPSFTSQNHCAVLCNYGRVIENGIPAVRDGQVALIVPVFDDVVLANYYERPERFNTVLESLRSFDERTAPSQVEFSAALRRAIKVQRDFTAESAAFHRRLVEKVFHDESLHGILIASRPYHLIADQMRSVDEKLAARGFAVLSPQAARASARDMPQSPDMDQTFNHGAFLHWVAESSIGESSVSVVFLHSAHCGYDAINIVDAQNILADGNRRSAVIDLDADEADIDARIEALTKDFRNELSHRSLEESDTLSPAQVIDLLVDSYQEQNLRLDVSKRFSDLPHAYCNTVSVLFNESYESLRNDSSLTEIHLPSICEGCLTDTIGSLLSRNLGRDITVRWDVRWDPSLRVIESGFSHRDAFAGFKADFADMIQNHLFVYDRADGDGYIPSIGLVGNPLLCFNGTLVDMIVQLIQKNGAEAVLPDSANFQSAAGGYLKQLDAYSAQGVDGVLCLQDIYCLKEHVGIRGSLQALQRRYPSMPLIAVEFGNDLSAVTLMNRVALVVGRALDKHREEVTHQGEGILEPDACPGGTA